MFTAHWAMNKIGGSGIDRSEIEAKFGHKMIYFGAAEGWLCAAPNQPLHLKQGNALSALLTFAVISEPRRIFIFGADGGVEASGATTTHYGADNKDFRLEIDDEKHLAVQLKLDTRRRRHRTVDATLRRRAVVIREREHDARSVLLRQRQRQCVQIVL